jgi:hypothetical protein
MRGGFWGSGSNPVLFFCIALNAKNYQNFLNKNILKLFSCLKLFYFFVFELSGNIYFRNFPRLFIFPLTMLVVCLIKACADKSWVAVTPVKKACRLI